MKYFAYLILILSLSIFIMGNSVNEDVNCADNPNYIYWPLVIDSTKMYRTNVKKYLDELESLEDNVKKFKLNIRKEEWRIYYALHLKYRELEVISKGKHAGNYKYYKEMQELYLTTANELRKINLRERVIKDKYMK